LAGGAPGGDVVRAELWLEAQEERGPALAAAALNARAQLLTRCGLLEDALACFRRLGQEFPREAVPGGATGADVLSVLAADRRFLPYLGASDAGRGRTRLRAVAVPLRPGEAPPAPLGPPSFRDLRVAADEQGTCLRVTDGRTGAETWSATLPAAVPGAGGAVACAVRDRTGHFAALDLGPVVVGLDLVGRRVRWARVSLEEDSPADPAAAGAQALGWTGENTVRLPDGREVPVISLVPPSGPGPPGVFLQWQTSLASVDPATGTVRWVRDDVGPGPELFGDGRHVYVGERGAVRAFRARDGVAVPIPDAAAAYAAKVRVAGRCVLASEERDGARVVRLYDVHTGEDVWKGRFPARSVVLDSPTPELASVLTPEGSLTVLDLVACREVLRASVDPRHLEKLRAGHLLRDRLGYYLALETEEEAAAGPAGGVAAGYFGEMATVPVSGMLYAFGPAGSVRWFNRVPNQALLAERFDELPVVVCSAASAGPPRGPAGAQAVEVATRSYDKRTGKLLYQHVAPGASLQPFTGLRVDAEAGTADLVSPTLLLRHFPEPAAP
jgi:hypothetical protein